MTEELWQLYDEQGRPQVGCGASKDDVFGKGLLHGASHVWIWRNNNGNAEVLLQKRSAIKRTWPNRYDISAAGHIDLGEEPVTAALRETVEEIGLVIDEKDLKLISVQLAYMTAENGAIENEYQWLYILELPSNIDFELQQSEIASIEWKEIGAFRSEVSSKPDDYVPHGSLYYETVCSAVEAELVD